MSIPKLAEACRSGVGRGRSWRLAGWLLPVLSLGGTALASGPDETSVRFVVPEGSKVVLQQPLQTDPNRLRVYIQFGQVVNGTDFQRRSARCHFLLNNRSTSPQAIEPDEFEVTRTRRQRRVQGGDENFATRMELSSERQPQVRELSCEILHPTTWVMRNHLTVADIREVLGEVVTLGIAESP